jgi:hypothetical protein
VKAIVALLAAFLVAGCSSTAATTSSSSYPIPSAESTVAADLNPDRANDPLVCAAVNTLGLPQVQGDTSNPQSQQAHLAWSLYFGSIVAYLDQNMPTFRGMVDEAQPEDRDSERTALEGVEEMRRVAEEGSLHTAGDPPTAAEVASLEGILDAFATATVDVCPSFATP